MLRFVSLLLASLPAFASDPVYTTIFYDGDGIVYAGLKRDASPDSDAHIVTFAYPDGERTRIALPEEIARRDVIGFLPDRDKLFVLTQGDDEASGDPRLDLYSRKKQTWKKIGQLDCPDFTKVKVAADRLTFFCEAGRTRRGKLRVHPKALKLGKERLYRSGIMRFPEFLLRFKGVTFILEGNAPTWDRMRIKSEDEKDRILSAKELFGAP